MFGFIDLKGDEPAPLLSNFVNHGGLFPNGLAAILLTMVTVNYSFQGTELVGIAAGESEDPAKTLPRSIRNIIWRTMFFLRLSNLCSRCFNSLGRSRINKKSVRCCF